MVYYIAQNIRHSFNKVNASIPALMITFQVKAIFNLNFICQCVVKEWPVVFRYRIRCAEKFLISIYLILIKFGNAFVHQTSHVFSFTGVLHEASSMICRWLVGGQSISSVHGFVKKHYRFVIGNIRIFRADMEIWEDNKHYRFLIGNIRIFRAGMEENMRSYQHVIWCFLFYKLCSNLEFLFLMMGQKFFWHLNLPDAFVCNDWSDWRRIWPRNHKMRSDNRMENHLYVYLHVFLSHRMS